MLFALPASAQDQPSLRANRVVFSGGLVWSGGYLVGETTGTYRGNAPGATPPLFTLLTVESSIRSVAGIEGSVGFALTPALAIEGGVAFSKPHIRVSVTQDAEGAVTTLDEAETLNQYVIGAGAVWQVPRVRLGSRIRPFVAGGGAYLRQLYEERTLVETGSLIYAGGGIRYWLSGGTAARRSLGLRADVRVNWRTDGVEFEDKTRVFPSLGVALFWQP